MLYLLGGFHIREGKAMQCGYHALQPVRFENCDDKHKLYCPHQTPAQAFIAKCQELKMTGQASYWITTEGELGETKTAYVDPTIVSVHRSQPVIEITQNELISHLWLTLWLIA